MLIYLLHIMSRRHSHIQLPLVNHHLLSESLDGLFYRKNRTETIPVRITAHDDVIATHELYIDTCVR